MAILYKILDIGIRSHLIKLCHGIIRNTLHTPPTTFYCTLPHSAVFCRTLLYSTVPIDLATK